VDPSHAVYSISVASELSGVDPQMLRAYEQRGLLTPFRTEGGTRRYSPDDVDRISDITSLLGDGLNLAGIGQVLQLRQETRRLAGQVGQLQAAGEPHRHEIRRLRRENRALQAQLDQRDDPDQADTGGPGTGGSSTGGSSTGGSGTGHTTDDLDGKT
jgi:MerR family transcriptional regulator/heat shock protein HspR